MKPYRKTLPRPFLLRMVVLVPRGFTSRIRLGYMTAQEARRDISYYLMHRYNWIRPHQFNHGLTPAQAEKKLNVVSGIS